MKKRIMVVDDEVSVTTLVARFLDHAGYDAVAVNQPREVPSLLQHQAFDALIVDLHMPEISGFELIESVARNWPGLPVIAISGTNRLTEVVKSMRLGAWDFVEKPFHDLSMLPVIIQKVIERGVVIRAEIQRQEILHHQNVVLEQKVEEQTTMLAEKNRVMEGTTQQHSAALEQLKAAQAQMVHQEKMASIGQLAAGVAHELNTPVGFVSSNFETIKDYVMKFRTLIELYGNFLNRIELADMPQLAGEMWHILQVQAESQLDFILEDLADLFDESADGFARIASIVSKLREFSRSDQSDAMVIFSLNNAVETTLVVAKNEYKYDAEVHLDLAPGLPEVKGYPREINQVLLNIIVNAAQAIKEQQRQEMGTIRISTFQHQEHLYCQVSDDGPGIKKEHLKHVFDPFFTTKAVGCGTGLGLNISYDIIVNKHRGELNVESLEGQGTTFTIALPLH
ncbi:MAG: response regulator [Deltaproteobacteria bacterium]|nr:response regulator [Candidatus Anaeroferrophillus wilburensis]MBN2889259.1 response regulator [Deltaproteobacteria bacterium]